VWDLGSTGQRPCEGTKKRKGGRLTGGSSLSGPSSSLVTRTARAPWPKPATPRGQRRHGAVVVGRVGLGSTARNQHRRSPATNRWDRENRGERKGGPAGKFTLGGAGTMARMWLTVAEHGRGRWSSSTSGRFGRRRPGGGEAPATLKNGCAQLG
jgi:hypothetical protein